MRRSRPIIRKSLLAAATALCLAALSSPVLAQSATGAVAGRADPGTVVTISNPATGYSRSITVGADGNYRFTALPVGNYLISAPSGTQDVVVSLGTTTSANFSRDAVELAGVVVKAEPGFPVIDVSSTESATNLTRKDLARLPVNQTVGSVALLAPGVNGGAAGFGGISFGGSSVAENAVYVNGLNVTDFYNRVGFSAAPFAFYQEFQVKTGGYSVEFGRTTGGVINAVSRSGSNAFHFGAEATLQPKEWQSPARDRFDGSERYYTASQDSSSLYKINAWASGPIIRDRLFFFLMAEGRDARSDYTTNGGATMNRSRARNPFWGGKLDWSITGNHTVSLMGFTDESDDITSPYAWDFDTRTQGAAGEPVNSLTGGRNWNATYTGHFGDAFTARVMYGKAARNASTSSAADMECNTVVLARTSTALPRPGTALGCVGAGSIFSRLDERTAKRVDFEWLLGSHQVRFGADHETNVSDHAQRYRGPGGYRYDVYASSPGEVARGPQILPPGYAGYVRQRRYEVAGLFESINSAFYLEDNWQISQRLMLNFGIRSESFDNKDSDGNTYIRMKNKIAPRLGASFDVNGDGTTKLFANLGRYYLPVANVINIKQAGGFLDERTFFAFAGWKQETRNGVNYLVPILGPRLGPVDTEDGDGSVGDLRSEVDRDMQQVFQDEAILGFQHMLGSNWAIGARAIYRKLSHAIDDMNLNANGACGTTGAVGWVMGNPGSPVTVWGDSNCDGKADGWVTLDTAREGWAMYDASGKYIGQRGWEKPRRNYAALEMQADRRWDGRWSANASYTLSALRGNAEGPVNSDTNFSDTGRTENFDDPWVNLGGYGPLANDRTHQFKLRGLYGISDNWQVGANVAALSGGPITGFGVGNPYDRRLYHSYFVCTANCNDPARRTYEYSPRGKYGTLPWVLSAGASLTYLRELGGSDLSVKLSVFNLFNRQGVLGVDQDRQTSLGSVPYNPNFQRATRWQSPRYAQLVLSWEF